MQPNPIKSAAKAALAAFAVFSLSNGLSAQSNDSFAGVWLRGAGSTFAAPLYDNWMAAFKTAHPELKLSYDAVGSGEGISRFITGSVDFAGTDAPLNADQEARVEHGVLHIPATAGMIALAYNLPNLKGELRLARDVYVDILSGRIRKWNDPRIQATNSTLELPNLSIVVVARHDSSGTTFALTNHLNTVSTEWRAGVGKVVDWPGSAMMGRGNEGVAHKIKIAHGAIGYVEYGFAKRLGLPMALLENKAGEFVRPEPDTGQQAIVAAVTADPDNLQLSAPDPAGATSYPLVTFSWSLLYRKYQNPAKAAAVKAFIDWGLSDGQKAAAELGYIPLPQAVALRAKLAAQTVQ